jgi:hypothetical protein
MTAGALAVIAAAGLVGPPALARLTSTGPLDPPTVPTALVVPAPLVRGVIVDPSGSNGGARAAGKDLDNLADVVAAWAGPLPPDGGQQAYTGMPGLDLTVRQVAQNSYGAGAEVAHIRIPSIPALPAAPADTSDVDATVEYLDNVDFVVEAHATARAAAKKAAKRIRRADLRDENSEIAGAVSAMVQVLPPSSEDRGIVVVSDVEQAGAAPQVDGDLSGTAVTVFQRCDAGADRCQSARESFTSLTRKLNGSDPQFLRVETLPANLGTTLKGQSS